jgi:hypothetical protein
MIKQLQSGACAACNARYLSRMTVAFWLKKSGWIVRKESWSLSLRAWICLLLASGLLAFFLFHRIFPFLAVHAPIKSDFLIVEGWIPDYAMAELEEEFARGEYRLLIITGNPILKGEHLSEYRNYAELTRANLLRTGWDENKVVAVSSAEALRERTFAAAQALRAWGVSEGIDLTRFNVMTRGAHGRRTWLLYHKAFEGQSEIGVLSGIDLRFDHKRWWISSEGVREVLNETIAYLYAKLLFRPGAPPHPEVPLGNEESFLEQNQPPIPFLLWFLSAERVG